MKPGFISNFIFLLLAASLAVQTAWAESQQRQGSGSLQARLNFSVTIPTILYLQVGSTGATVDTISFDVTTPVGTPVEGYSSGTYPVPVRAAFLVPDKQHVDLSADSHIPLTNGTTNISFNHIDVMATGAVAGKNFNGQPSQQFDQFNKGSGDYRGLYRFFYDNAAAQPAGIYTGRVTFTLSLP